VRNWLLMIVVLAIPACGARVRFEQDGDCGVEDGCLPPPQEPGKLCPIDSPDYNCPWFCDEQRGAVEPPGGGVAYGRACHQGERCEFVCSGWECVEQDLP
jgi:hypothetical protein